MKTYDSDKVTVSINGIPITEPVSEGNFVEVAYDTPQFTDVVSLDGTVTRSKTNDKRATVTIRVMQSSNMNDLLSALLEVDQLAPGGAGVGTLLITDTAGTTLLSASEAWISEYPQINFGREGQERAWVVRCAKLGSFIGGNS